MTWESSFAAKARAACDLASKAAWTHPDSAASRAYYAVVAGLNARLGPTVDGRPRRHGHLRSWTLASSIGLERVDVIRIHWLYDLRSVADYQEEAVGERRAVVAAQAAASLLATMGFLFP